MTELKRTWVQHEITNRITISMYDVNEVAEYKGWGARVWQDVNQRKPLWYWRAEFKRTRVWGAPPRVVSQGVASSAKEAMLQAEAEIELLRIDQCLLNTA